MPPKNNENSKKNLRDTTQQLKGIEIFPPKPACKCKISTNQKPVFLSTNSYCTSKIYANSTQRLVTWYETGAETNLISNTVDQLTTEYIEWGCMLAAY